MKVRRQHSHDYGRGLSAADNHGMPEDGCVPSEAPLEIFVTEDCDERKLGPRRASRCGSRLRQSVSILKITAHRNSCPHEPEEIGRDDGLPYLFRTAILGENCAAKGEDAGKILERLLRAFAQIDVIGIRELQVLHMPLP